jgi:hypothetical protein
MPGRPLVTDAEAARRGFGDARSARRREVLRDTIEAFSNAMAAARYRSIAQNNLARWQAKRRVHPSKLQIEVLSGDWGEVALAMTEHYGACFAVLNMANAFVPGGAYVEGAIAQEENMFRRTDCHYYLGPPDYDDATDQYSARMTALLEAENGLVYLDAEHPRTCVRGPEDRTRPDLGYRWLDDVRIFPFFELRSAALDLRDGLAFDRVAATKRIAAQLDTLRLSKIRYVTLGAHGCGAFLNPADEIALIYRQEIERRRDDFTVVSFAIFNAGYGPDNYTPFMAAFR